MSIAENKLPKNIEAEKATLGAAMMSKIAADDIVSSLIVEDFYLKIHQQIYGAIFSIAKRNGSIDIQTVTEELKNLKMLDEIGGVDYLLELARSMLSLDNVKEYIDIVKQNSNLRNLFKVMKEIEDDYLRTEIENPVAFVGEAQQKIDKVADQRKISNFSSSKKIVADVQKHIYDVVTKRKDREWTGLDTGFKLLNYYTNGLQKQNLIIVAGRPGMGKTAFALQLALNVAMKDDVSVGIFEMEMSSIMLYSRLVSNLSDVPSRKILSGKLESGDKVAVQEALDKLSQLKIYVDESSALTIMDIATKARKLKLEQPDLGLIVIDYIGLIASDNRKSGRRYDSRQLEIQEYTRTLHELARELNLPIILLCQLNRKVEERGEGGTPRLSDLRESGAIEQDAEIVLLLHRDDYGKNPVLEKKQREKTTAANMSAQDRRELVQVATQRVAQQNQEESKKSSPFMDVIIAKNRNGESDQTVSLMFEKQFSRFRETNPDFNDRRNQLQNKYMEEE